MRTRLVLGVLLVTVSCVSAPKVGEAPLDVPTPDAWTAAETPSGEIDQAWWTDFGEPELTRIVEQEGRRPELAALLAEGEAPAVWRGHAGCGPSSWSTN